MASIAGTNLAAPVVPFTTDDFYPTHKAQYGHGGWREVASIADRDAIPAARREAGMAVYITADHTLYVLNDDLTTWTEFKSKSSDGIRAISDLTNCTPLYAGEIVEYTGVTDQNYTNGYFYKNESSIQNWVRFEESSVAGTVCTCDFEDFLAFIETIEGITPSEIVRGSLGFYSGTPDTSDARYSITLYNSETFVKYFTQTVSELEAAGFTFNPYLSAQDGLQFTCAINREISAWERIDVQPSLVDNTTIVKDANQVITTIGVKTKSNDIMYDWIGTLAQWQAGRQAGTIPDSWICWITDDEDEPAGIANLAQVASSGSYNDLVNKPVYSLPDLPIDKNIKDYMLKWDHTLQALVWEELS